MAALLEVLLEITELGPSGSAASGVSGGSVTANGMVKRQRSAEVSWPEANAAIVLHLCRET
jgi:hypothetical protein